MAEATEGGQKCAVSSESSPIAKAKIKHDWYQTDTHVIITVLLKNAPQDQVQISYGATTLSLSCPLPSSTSPYSLELNLAHEINLENCSLKVTPAKMEIKLSKRDGHRWATLEQDHQQDKPIIKSIPQAVLDASGPPTAPKYPTSRPGGRDWNQIEKEINKQEAEEKPEGDAALKQLFEQIYGGGSDEVRKAMNKSFVESGGTVLSTNWKQVSKDKVDMNPPDGMEFKKWDS